MSNLVTELLKSDPKNMEKRRTAKFKSWNMGKALGKDGPVEIELTALNYDEIMNIKEYITRRDGSVDAGKVATGDIMLCVKGISDPNLNNEDLQSFCGVSTAIDAAKKLFDTELIGISRALMDLSNANEDTEDVIKN